MTRPRQEQISTALAYAAFGWLALSGAMHLVVDVLAPYVSASRTPGAETTLYYGLNTSYALGKVGFGLLCLRLMRRCPRVMGERVVIAICVVVAVGWLGISVLFMEYWQPRAAAAVFLLLVLGMALTARRQRDSVETRR